MKTTYKREDLLRKINSVAPGISAKENVEQSSCFVFQGGMLYTYNEEIFCSTKCDIGHEGALESKPLMDILGKLTEDTIDLEQGEGELVIKGKSKRAGITMAAEIKLPIDSVVLPKEGAWGDLHDDFCDAIALVAECAGKNKTEFVLTCVHVTPTCIEACDNTQLARYKIKTPIKANTIVRRDSIKHITGLGMSEVAETKNFIHFRNPDGLVISCRRYTDEFNNLDDAIKVENGITTELPKGLADAADKAAIFASTGEDDNVLVKIEEGYVTISSKGASGWYKERRKIKYKGKEIVFRMAPKIMADVVKKHDEFVISDTKLKVEDKHFTYVTCLNLK